MTKEAVYSAVHKNKNLMMIKFCFGNPENGCLCLFVQYIIKSNNEINIYNCLGKSAAKSVSV